jgi:DNA-binding response OmpR family regulator
VIEPPRDPRVVLVAPPGPAASALEEELRAAGFFVDFAADPGAIREGLAARDATLIVDVDAPRLDGMEIVARALERNPLAAVVALIAPANEERGLEAMERGATGVMVRPGSARQVSLFVRRAGERRDLLDRVR